MEDSAIEYAVNDDVLLRRVDQGVPEIYAGDGEWRAYPSFVEWMESSPIDEEAAKDLMRRLDKENL